MVKKKEAKDKKKPKKTLKKIWHFIWEEDSIWSWIVNIILAFVLIKFVVYPGLGLILSTSHPIVAVVSGSMEHNNMDVDEWWSNNDEWYLEHNITKDEFLMFPIKNGFNKGDIMVLKGKKAKDIKVGDVIVFQGGKADPIIHRVVRKWKKEDQYYFQTKGDNNADSISGNLLDEMNISEEKVIGNASFKIPFLGYIKIWFVELLRLFTR